MKTKMRSPCIPAAVYITFLLYLVCVANGYSQNKLVFKILYKPNSTYDNKVIQRNKIHISYEGSESFLKELKNNGLSNPTNTEKNLEIEGIIKTGKCLDGRQFPFQMEYINTSNSSGKSAVPNGTIMYGRDSIGQMPIIDSIHSNELNEETKKKVLPAIQSVFAQIIFPNHAMGVNDAFTDDKPLSFAVAGRTIEMNVISTYRLVRISNGTAVFEVKQEYKVKETSSDPGTPTVTMSGEGKGELIYDISGNFVRKSSIDYVLRATIIADRKGDKMLMTITAGVENLMLMK